MSDLLSTPKQKGELYLASSLCDGLEDNDLRQVATLLKSKEADPNVLMPLHGITPFHLVIGNDSEAFAEEVTKLFLRHGGNPNVKSIDGMTPVHVAAAWGRTKILKLLLANGGDPLCDDNDNCTPFNYAFQGEHYEAVSVLSKFCIDDKEDDYTPKFKRELDKVIINNGDVLAEYILSDESNSSIKSSLLDNNNHDKISCLSGYIPECASIESNLNKSISERKKMKKRRAQQKKTEVVKDIDNQNTFDFVRETEEEEMNLINEIISKLSSSVVSNADVSFQNYENSCLNNYRTSSPKRMQMTMTFHRSENCSKSTKEKLNSTLKVIKGHTHIPCFKNNNVIQSNLKKSNNITEKNTISKKFVQSSKKNENQSNLRQQTPKNVFRNDWLDETIISKSPNLILESNNFQEKRRKQFQNLTFDKKETSFELSTNSASNGALKKDNQSNVYETPVSKIPRLKKNLMTPGSVKSNKAVETPKSNSIHKINSFKGAKSEPPQNCTINKFDASKSSLFTRKTKQKSLKNIAINLNDCTYEREVKEKTLNTLTYSKSENSMKNKDITEECEKFNCNNMISGIGILGSESSSKSDSHLENLSNGTEEEVVFHEAAVDLNQAISDYFSSAESKQDQNYDIIENSHKFSDSNSVTSCVICEKSLPTDASTSFLSLAGYESTYRDENFEKNEDSMCQQSVSPNSDPLSSGDDSCKKFGSEMFLSMEEEYKYEDLEEGVIFVERRLCVTPSCASSEINTSYYSCSTAKSEPLPKELYLMDNAALRERLKILGENPGPITKTTHHLYLKRLHKLQTKKKN